MRTQSDRMVHFHSANDAHYSRLGFGSLSDRQPFDTAFPFVVTPPLIDPDPIFTPDDIMGGTRPDGPDAGNEPEEEPAVCPQGWTATPIPGKCCPYKTVWDGERCKRGPEPRL